MKEIRDTYKTVSTASGEVLYKDKNSKFFGYVIPVESEEEIKEHLDDIKKKHHGARHWCYAWQLGKNEIRRHYRANDDGEPSNSAGMPIYGQIQSFNLTNVLVVVVRYFGGIKLGVGGLISAYKTTAQMALEAAHIVEKTIDVDFEISFDYPEMNKVMRVLKENSITITDQKLALDCKIYISVREKEAETIFQKFENIYKVDIKKLEE